MFLKILFEVQWQLLTSRGLRGYRSGPSVILKSADARAYDVDATLACVRALKMAVTEVEQQTCRVGLLYLCGSECVRCASQTGLKRLSRGSLG